MLLSEAMIKGIEGHEQAFQEFFSADGKCRCALGSACAGFYDRAPQDDAYTCDLLALAWPALYNHDPEDGLLERTDLCQEIVYMNDVDRKTVPEIAAILAERGL